uniref:Uncharacterized protein n=1 Tax=Arundo donax TaxID=35708 RepID=A0A0A8YAG0_ARUDO
MNKNNFKVYTVADCQIAQTLHGDHKDPEKALMYLQSMCTRKCVKANQAHFKINLLMCHVRYNATLHQRRMQNGSKDYDKILTAAYPSR